MQATGVAGTTQQLVEALKGRGFNFFTGVADSTVASLIEELGRDRARVPAARGVGEGSAESPAGRTADPAAGYVPAVREEQAVGLASGAYVSGRWPCVLMQNSGLGYSLNALTSLNLIYKIPLLLIVGWRGYQGKDAPEHLVMGAHCRQLLEEVGIPATAPEADGLAEAVAKADAWMRSQRTPVALLIKPGVLT